MKLELYIELTINFSKQTAIYSEQNAMLPMQSFVKDSGFLTAAAGSNFQVQSWFKSMWFSKLPASLCDFCQVTWIRPIKGLRHCHASSSNPRRDFSNHLQHLPTLPTRQIVSGLVCISNPEQGGTWIKQWEIPKTWDPSMNLLPQVKHHWCPPWFESREITYCFYG